MAGDAATTRRPAVVAAWLGLAAVAATFPAAADDLPPEPIDYVRACKAVGDGYFAVPGTDTCFAQSGYVQAEFMVFASNAASRQPGYYSPRRDGYVWRGRTVIFMSSSTDTEYGPLASYIKVEITDDTTVGVFIEPKHIYLQFNNITAGRRQSFYDFYTGNTFEDFYEPAWSDWETNTLGYTLDLGGPLSATVAIEDAVTRDIGIKFGDRSVLYGPGYGGPLFPDPVANLNLSGDWGEAQLMGALHTLRAARRGAERALGWAVGGGVTLNLPFLAEGDSASLEGNFSRGALAYAANDPIGPGRGFAGADAVATNGGRSLSLAEAWSIGGGITHNWTDAWSTTVEASYLSVDQIGRRFDFTNVDFQANLIFEPVSQLQIGVEAEYKFIGRNGRSDGESLMTMFVVERDF